MKKFTKNVTRMLAAALASLQLLATAPLGDFQVPDADYANMVSLAVTADIEESEAVEIPAKEEDGVCCCGDDGKKNENPLGDLIEGD